MKHIDVKLEKVYPVHNVSKYKWSEDKSMYKEIEVIKYPFDVTSIYTLQTLGASISVVLFLVDLSTEDVYFLCLNDYIDKIILPMKPNYTDQKTLTLTIPTLNNLKDSALSDIALRFYGKRAKLLAAFSKFYYQNNELRYLVPGNVEIIERALFFISQIEDLDIWKYIEWGALSIARERIVNLKKYLNSNNFDLYTASDKIFENWRLLTNLGSIYEDLCREWFLPKYISILTSYPEV